MVDTINGKKLDKPVAIDIDNLEPPHGVRCVIKGYENMQMVGAAPAEEQAAKEAGKPFIPPQAVWQVRCYFKALAVAAPKNLKIGKSDEADPAWDRSAKAPSPIHVSELTMRPPVGLLDEPLGTRVLVEGRRAEWVLLANPLKITSVNGKPLATPVEIELSGIDQIKPNVNYKLEGYESGDFAGDPNWLSPGVQQPFQYRPSFVVVRVIANGHVGK